MVDRDYRWSSEHRGGGGSRRQSDSNERDFYGRTSFPEDDYGTGYGEEGLTNYSRRYVGPQFRGSGRGPENYGDVRSHGGGERDAYGGGPVGRGSYGGGRYRSHEQWGRGLDDDYDRGAYVRDRGYGSRPNAFGGDYGHGERDYYRGRDPYRRDDRHERGWWDRASDEVQSWFGDEDAEHRRARDAREDARHAGRGPRGYKRSDERIREDVSDRLTDDPYIDASDIEVTVEAAEVTLAGSVDSRMGRRRAEDIAEHVSGVTHVQNNLRVNSGSETTREEREALHSGAAARPGATRTGGL